MKKRSKRASQKGSKKLKDSSKYFRRISAKRLLLTYPQVDDMPAEHLLSELRTKIKFIGYVICEEYHDDDESRHFHVLLTTPKKFSIRFHFTLDVLYEGKMYSGMYESVKNLQAVLMYITKGFSCQSNMLPLKRGAANSVEEAGILPYDAPITLDVADKLFSEGPLSCAEDLPIVLKNLLRTCWSKPQEETPKSSSDDSPKADLPKVKATRKKLPQAVSPDESVALAPVSLTESVSLAPQVVKIAAEAVTFSHASIDEIASSDETHSLSPEFPDELSSSDEIVSPDKAALLTPDAFALSAKAQAVLEDDTAYDVISDYLLRNEDIRNEEITREGMTKEGMTKEEITITHDEIQDFTSLIEEKRREKSREKSLFRCQKTVFDGFILL